MNLSVIICTYNRANLLRTTLQSLADVVVPRCDQYELVIVDNNSADSTRQVIHEATENLPFPVKYVFEERQGLCYARNAALQTASGDVLAFTDDDVELDRSWLTNLIDPLITGDFLGVAGRIVPVWEGERPSWLVTSGPNRLLAAIVEFDQGQEPKRIRSSPFGANMAFKREAFSRFGNFREDLDRIGDSLIGGGDTEFGFRLLHAGERIAYAPDAVVYHPVEEERMTKQYFKRWYYSYGRAEVRIFGGPSGTVRWFGVPRFLFRELAESILHWVMSWGTESRFAQRLNIHRTFGKIVEYRSRPQR